MRCIPFLYLLILLFSSSINAQIEEGLATPHSTAINNQYSSIPLSLLDSLAYQNLTNQQLDTSIFYAYLLLQKSLSLDQQVFQKNAYWYLGRAYFLANKLTEAFPALQQALELSEERGDSVVYVRAANSLGLVLSNFGKVADALKVYHKAVKWSEAIGDDFHTATLCNNLGIAYNAIEAYNFSIKFLSKGQHFAHRINDSLLMATIGVNKASSFSHLNQLDSAKLYSVQAQELFLQLKDTNRLLMIYANRSDRYLREKDYATAKEFANLVLNALQHSTKKEAIRSELMIIALINIYDAEIGLSGKKQTRYLSQVASFLKDYNHPEFSMELHKRWIAYYQEKENYAKAFEHSQQYILLKDSLFNQIEINKVFNTESNASLMKKQLKIGTLEALNQRQETSNQHLKTFLFYFFLFFLFTGIISIIYWVKQKQARLTLSQQAAENKLEALRNQINPHFIFNSFTAIQYYILKSDKHKANKYLTEFARLLRQVLENASSLTIELSKEINLLKSYISIKALRFEGQFTYQFILDESLIVEDVYIPSMIIQPYIENAILHGLSNKKDNDGYLEISLSKMLNKGEAYLVCVIEDNGIGRKKAMEIKQQTYKHQTPHTSIAMNNTQQRLQILGKTGYRASKVHVEDLYVDGKPVGTKVQVELPLL